MRIMRSAIVARVPLALASALIIGACIVPGLDGDFRLDPDASASSTTSTSGGSTSTTSTASSSSTTTSSSSSSSSSGELDASRDGASTSSSSSSSSSGSGTVDAGPVAFCVEEEKRATVKFCSDFTGPETARPWDWTETSRLVNGSLTVDNALLNKPERLLVARVNADGPPQNPGNPFPGAGISFTLPGGVPDGKVLTARFEVTVDASSDTYADLAVVQVGTVQRGLAVNPCGGGKMCLRENDGPTTFQGQELTLVPTTTYVGVITVTHGGGNWTSKVAIVSPVLANPTLNERVGNGYPGGGTVKVLIGAENGGSMGANGSNFTRARIDNVVVELK